jgi:hypothetical protein
VPTYAHSHLGPIPLRPDPTCVLRSHGVPSAGCEVKIFKCDEQVRVPRVPPHARTRIASRARASQDLTKKTECPRTANLKNPSEAEQGEICFRGRHIMMG